MGTEIRKFNLTRYVLRPLTLRKQNTPGACEGGGHLVLEQG